MVAHRVLIWTILKSTYALSLVQLCIFEAVKMVYWCIMGGKRLFAHPFISSLGRKTAIVRWVKRTQCPRSRLVNVELLFSKHNTSTQYCPGTDCEVQEPASNEQSWPGRRGGALVSSTFIHRQYLDDSFWFFCLLLRWALFLIVLTQLWLCCKVHEANSSDRTQQECWPQNVISPLHYITVITNAGGLKSTLDMNMHTQSG